MCITEMLWGTNYFNDFWKPVFFIAFLPYGLNVASLRPLRRGQSWQMPFPPLGVNAIVFTVAAVRALYANLLKGHCRCSY
mmetsp:Transcript_68772/g.109126  ORF Transcript_68772/g.109126 Transcript_68772/m.109126 type:complete len:80 (+) Transcript_68772:82-321(+)